MMEILITDEEHLTLLRALSHYEVGTLSVSERERVGALQAKLLASRKFDDASRFHLFDEEKPTSTEGKYFVRARTIDGENDHLFVSEWNGEKFSGVKPSDVISWTRLP